MVLVEVGVPIVDSLAGESEADELLVDGLCIVGRDDARDCKVEITFVDEPEKAVISKDEGC